MRSAILGRLDARPRTNEGPGWGGLACATLIGVETREVEGGA